MDKVRELRGAGSPFPFDLTAFDAASPILEEGPCFRFGQSKEGTVALIREIADRIENGDYLLQGMESTHKLDISDYAMNTFSIRVAQKTRFSPRVQIQQPEAQEVPDYVREQMDAKNKSH